MNKIYNFLKCVKLNMLTGFYWYNSFYNGVYNNLSV